MFRKQHYVALGAVTLTAALVLNLPPSAALRLKTGIGVLFLPLFGLASTARELPRKAVDAVLPRSELLKEIKNLRRENEELKVRQQQGDAALLENNQLRAAVGWQRQQPWKLRLARVILRDPANWWRTIQIDLGTHDGVQNNFPVLTPQGLIGRDSDAGLYKSQVVLLGDPACRVSASVVNPAHDMGILTAGEPLDNSLLNLTYLSGNANLKSGEEVVTSGQGGFFPPGIRIGEIYDSRQVEYGLYSEARVKLSANLGALDEVWVLMK